MEEYTETMNVLLVDDNVPIVQGLKDSIHWAKLSFQQVLGAYSMTEAIEQFRSKQIALLISDIELPDGDGLTLISWVKKTYPDCICIILSSFPNFDYAKRAISLGVSEYLLKPVDKLELEHSITKSMALYYGQTAQTPKNKTSPSVSESVLHIQQYIEQHLAEEISRSTLAESFGFNPEYLSTMFKKETGDTLSEYIQKKRLSVARKLLLQTNLPISLISQSCGYETLSYFSTVFRQKTGMSPREYRKIHATAEKI